MKTNQKKQRVRIMLVFIIGFTLMQSALLFAEGTREEAVAQMSMPSQLTGLRVREAAKTAALSSEFKPDLTDYYMYTQADTYGVEFTPEGEGTFLFNGNEIAAGESFVFELPQKQEDMYAPYFGKVEIVAGDATYTYTIIREDPKYMNTEAFEKKTFALEGGEMYYWLHVPKDYDPARKYPVVLYLHGGGQARQPADMVLLRTQAAGSFVKYGYEAIVIAPQANYTDLSAKFAIPGWGDNLEISPFGQAAYDILQLVKNQYNIDGNREYLTGLSMGAIGSYAMLSTYPSEFAAAMLNASEISTDDALGKDYSRLTAALKKGGTKIMMTHGTGDESINFAKFQEETAALNQADIPYQVVVYGPDDFLYPMRHFAWQPAYANRDNLDWLFKQSRDKDKAIVDIKVEDPALMDTPAFKTNVSKYDMHVLSDTYGIRFTVYGNGPFTINGEDVESGEQWILDFPQDQKDMRTEFTKKVVISGGNQTYTYTITREELSSTYDEFELKTWKLADGSGEMYYWLRLPKNYNPSKKYPVVLYLHGGGQSNQPIPMVLMRNRAATAFAFADEECIIVAPQKNYTDLSIPGGPAGPPALSGWASGDDLTPTIFGEAAAEITKSVISKYSSDVNRVSITGLSMGCTGALGVAAAYPTLFSAVLCATPTIADASALKALGEHDIPVRFVMCATDPNPNKLKTYTRLHEAIDAYGIDWEETIYWSNTFIYPSQHWSWAMMYADQDNINWLLSRVKN